MSTVSSARRQKCIYLYTELSLIRLWIQLLRQSSEPLHVVSLHPRSTAQLERLGDDFLVCLHILHSAWFDCGYKFCVRWRSSHSSYVVADSVSQGIVRLFGSSERSPSSKAPSDGVFVVRRETLLVPRIFWSISCTRAADSAEELAEGRRRRLAEFHGVAKPIFGCKQIPCV